MKYEIQLVEKKGKEPFFKLKLSEMRSHISSSVTLLGLAERKEVKILRESWNERAKTLTVNVKMLSGHNDAEELKEIIQECINSQEVTDLESGYTYLRNELEKFSKMNTQSRCILLCGVQGEYRAILAFNGEIFPLNSETCGKGIGILGEMAQEISDFIKKEQANSSIKDAE